MKTKLKKNTIKRVKAWAIIDCNGDIVSSVKDTGYEIHENKKYAKCNLINKTEKVITVLITPITKVDKNKVGK